MKRLFRDRRSSSFTLVELLVVISIIAILASVVIGAYSSAMKAALRAKAQVMASQIQTACMAYYNDYGVYPLSTNPAPTTQAEATFGTTSTDQQNWEYLIWALCGNINAATPGTAPSTLNVPNPRSIIYLSLNKSSIDANGIPINPVFSSTPGTYFNISMDPTYSGILSNVPIFSPGLVGTSNMMGGVYVWANCNVTGASNGTWWVHAP